MRSVHSGRLERWLGAAQVEHISRSMKGWYGPPIHLLDCPGSVRVCADGDFIGPFERGYLLSAMDALEIALKRAIRGSGKVHYGVLNAGFSSISDALSRASQGFVQYPAGAFNKVGPTGVVGVTSRVAARAVRAGAAFAAGASST